MDLYVELTSECSSSEVNDRKISIMTDLLTDPIPLNWELHPDDKVTKALLAVNWRRVYFWIFMVWLVTLVTATLYVCFLILRDGSKSASHSEQALGPCPGKINETDIRSLLQYPALITKDNIQSSVLRYKPHVNIISSQSEPDKVISCYYNTPQYDGSGQLLPSDINPHLCTHINIAFFQIVNKTIHLEPNQKKAIKEVLKLKEVNPKLKIMLSIGGAGNSKSFSDMVVNHASRKTFIKSIKSVLRNFSLDGIDLDWEFPAVHLLKNDTDKNRERQHFSQLLREIRAEYQREKRKYLLTIAAAAPEAIVNASYDMDQINLYTDFVNIMTYDFHSYTKYTPFTGLNSPLYARSEEKLYLSTLNINYTCNMFIRKGLDRNKIVVGIPTYGHSFNLVNAENANIGSPASGYGKLGSKGFVDYSDICKFMQRYHSQIHYKEESDAQVPYLYMSNDWLSFDNIYSVKKKAQFINDNNLGGAMIYSLNADDYTGACDLPNGDVTKFPLSHSVRRTLLGDKI